MAELHDSLVRLWRHVTGHTGRLLATLSVVIGLALVGFSQVRMQQVVDKVEHEAELRIATQCVASHERIEQIRDGDEKAYRGGAEAIIAVATEADPEDVRRYREVIEGTVLDIRSANPDPDCDLEQAKKTLAE